MKSVKIPNATYETLQKNGCQLYDSRFRFNECECVKTLINVTFCRAEHSEASLPLLQRE